MDKVQLVAQVLMQQGLPQEEAMKLAEQIIASGSPEGMMQVLQQAGMDQQQIQGLMQQLAQAIQGAQGNSQPQPAQQQQQQQPMAPEQQMPAQQFRTGGSNTMRYMSGGPTASDRVFGDKPVIIIDGDYLKTEKHKYRRGGKSK